LSESVAQYQNLQKHLRHLRWHEKAGVLHVDDEEYLIDGVSGGSSRGTWGNSKKEKGRKNKATLGSTYAKPGFKEAEQEPVPEAAEAVRSPNLIIHATVYALAEKYGVAGLKALALEKFSEEADQHWDNTDFVQAATEVYTGTPKNDRGMRDIVVSTFMQHKSLLRKLEAIEVLKDTDLGFELLMCHAD
jgi:ABC-type branched-subunit amino acid transport system substrate-binding protein